MSVEKFFKQRAVAVNGNYSLHRWYDQEGGLRTPFRMIVEVPVVGRIGDRLTSYFGAFGAFEGRISDSMYGSVLLELEMTRAQRERMSEQLTWLEKRQGDPTPPDERGRCPLRPEDLSLDADAGRRQYPRLLHHRHVGLRRGRLGGARIDDRNAAGRGRLRRPHRQNLPRRLRDQVRRKAESGRP